jgi:hypothetical protein
MSNSNLTTIFKTLSATCLLAISSVSQAAITAFSDDFEGYGVAGVPVPENFTPWGGFSDNGGFPGGYVFTPPSSGPQITALGYNGSDNQYLNFYANYDNVNVHDRVNCSPCSPFLQEALSLFRMTSFDGTDTASGDTWVLSFRYREGDIPPAGATQVGAFIRVFDPVWNLLAEATLDTSGSSSWQSGNLAVTLDPAWLNGNIQVGFNNLVGGYEDSGVYYDDATFVNAQANVEIEGRGWSNDKLHPHHNDEAISPYLDDVIPIVVYGSSTSVGDPTNLDTDLIDLATVRFGPGGAAISPSHPPQFDLDVDSDGIDDARFNFLMSDSELACSDSSGTLTGDLTTSENFASLPAFTAACSAQCHAD